MPSPDLCERVRPDTSARPDLEEEDLARNISERLPAEALSVERACRVEVSGGDGDEVDFGLHGDHCVRWPRLLTRSHLVAELVLRHRLALPRVREAVRTDRDI